jgi:hypothetical protein
VPDASTEHCAFRASREALLDCAQSLLVGTAYGVYRATDASANDLPVFVAMPRQPTDTKGDITMSTLHQLQEGWNEAWDTVVDGWQRLYRHAAGAITRFTPGKRAREDTEAGGQPIAMRSAGWGVLAAEVR